MSENLGPLVRALPESSVTFRRVRADEANAVFQILLDNGEWMLKNDIEQWPMEWLASIEAEVKRSVCSGGYWCMDVRGDIAACVEVNRTPEQLWGFDPEPSSYLHKLAISRPPKGTSIGSQLLAATINMARSRGSEFVRLDCVASNERLQRYYERLGFECKGLKRVDDGVGGEVELALFELAISRQ
ncbi:MAG: GNAT family N-acetyltransferase [Pseudomonadaceae bacterium]|nr:GNAT family N-acetyltransferase [Pseudomonadaceae bacterium]